MTCLRWSLEWTPKADFLATLKRYGEPLPEAYLNRPELRSHTLFFWDAFAALETDRQIGMAEGPIPFSAIDRFARRYGITDLDSFDRFYRIMRAMDDEVRKARAEQSKRKAALKERLDEEAKDNPAKPKPPKMLRA